MRPLLGAELIKLRTTRTFVALTAAAVGISLLFTILIAAIEEPTQDEVLTTVFRSDASSLFILILAIVGISGEWRHRTITSSLLAAPDRVRFLAAKTLAFATAGLLLSLLVSVAVSVFGLLILGLRDLPTPGLGDLVGLWGRNAGVAALLGAFGVAVGALVRNQAVAIVGVLIWMLVFVPILAGLAPDVAVFDPTSALPTAVADIDPEDTGLPNDVDLLAPGVAAVVMLAWIASGFAAAAALLRARDLH